jgi:hypothetical protein
VCGYSTERCSSCGATESARDACFRLCTHNTTPTSTCTSICQ